MSNITINETYLRKDLTELISEKFAQLYNVDVSKWITPFGYYDEKFGSIISNTSLPDGVYVVLGSVSYPGKARMSRHIIYQFNIARSRGIDLRWAERFRPYPNVPKALDIRPIYPMFRVEDLTKYEECKTIYYELEKTQYFAVDQLKEIIKKGIPGSVKDTIYRLRLALQREIEKDRRKY